VVQEIVHIPLTDFGGKCVFFVILFTSFREFSFQDFRDGLANNMINNYLYAKSVIFGENGGGILVLED